MSHTFVSVAVNLSISLHYCGTLVITRPSFLYLYMYGRVELCHKEGEGMFPRHHKESHNMPWIPSPFLSLSLRNSTFYSFYLYLPVWSSSLSFWQHKGKDTKIAARKPVKLHTCRLSHNVFLFSYLYGWMAESRVQLRT